MSYAIVPAAGLGRVFTATLKTPWGSEKFSVDVPLENMAEAAMSAAWPPAEKRLKGALPGLMDTALKQAGGYMKSTLWPQMQPLIRKETDRVLADATKRLAVLVGVIVLAEIGTAVWIRRGIKKGVGRKPTPA